jgi:uncharacterized iron-regulated protein
MAIHDQLRPVWRVACAVIALGLLLIAAPGNLHAKSDARLCAKPGDWLDPTTRKTIPSDRLLASLTKRQIVLLGERHTVAEHHRWQAQMLAALHAHRSKLVVGFEMFPRRVQPALDRWSRGELEVGEFLQASRWREVWGFDPAFYLPLLHFVRQNRLPAVALNIDSALVSAVARKGWAAIPVKERDGVSDPAPASDAYKKSLAEVFAEKQKFMTRHKPGAAKPKGTPGGPKHAEPDIASILKSKDFTRFVEAQLTWDRAMAEALAKGRRHHPGSLVVGVIGRGHVEFGYGVPHQLADLGVRDVAVLLAVEAEEACENLPADLADAVFVVDPANRIETASPKPRLGVMIEQAADGVRVAKVLAGSVAEATGIASGDIIVSAAGFPTKRRSELIEIVQRQAPGTWLPLGIKRADQSLDLVAKFPKEFGKPE